MADLMDAPNQQAVRADGSGPGIDQPAAKGPVERSIEQAGPPAEPPQGHQRLGHREAN